jgi:hypothetical protein
MEWLVSIWLVLLLRHSSVYRKGNKGKVFKGIRNFNKTSGLK